MNYVQTYRPWLIKILNMRIYCSRQGYRPELLTPALELKALIQFNGYRHPEKLAGFILRKKEQIETLITNNKSYENNIQIFKKAITEAQRKTRSLTTTRTNSNCLHS